MQKLPLPGENPIAVNALRNKRAQLAGEIEMHAREIDRLRAELLHVDATLRLFDPETDPADVGTLRCYPRRTEWFAQGEIRRRIYDALRQQEMIWPVEIARAAMAEKGIAASDKATARDIIARFVNASCYLTRRGMLEKVGHGRGARWKLPLTEPDLL
jgi:hypothetical protein